MVTTCRICGEAIYSGISKAKHLFDSKNCSFIMQQIEALTGVWLDDLPDMPQHICMPCQFDLDQAIGFRERCINTQVQLAKMLLNKEHAILTNSTHTKADGDFSSPVRTARSNHGSIIVFEGNTTDAFYLKEHHTIPSKSKDIKTERKDPAVEKVLKAYEEKKDQVCHHCGRRFTDKYYAKLLLQLHIKTVHDDARPYKCSISNCGKSFKYKYVKIQHERTHSKSYTYNCKNREHGSNTSSHRKTQERKHTDEHPYKCELCNVFFPQNFQLKLHNRTQRHQKIARTAKILDNKQVRVLPS